MRGLLGRLGLLTLLAGVMVAFAPAPGAAAEPGAMVRIVHASPDAPAVDIFVDGQLAAAGLSFAESTTYAMFPAGQHRLQVAPTGAGLAGQIVIDRTADLRAGGVYTVVAVNPLARIEPIVVSDDVTPPAAGTAHVRLIHAAVDAPTVDLAIAGGRILFTNAAFKSATPYVAVDAGSYRFDVRTTGAGGAIAVNAPAALASGRIYTVFALGRVADNTFQAIAFADNADVGMANLPSAGAGGGRVGSGALPPFLVGALPALLATLLALVLRWRTTAPRDGR